MKESLLEKETQELGRQIFELIGEEPPSIFKKDWWSGRVLEWCLRKPAFKVQMFRFVDVLPSLRSSRQIAQHIREYFSQPGVELPKALEWALRSFSANPVTSPLVAGQIRRNVQEMAHRFILAPTLEEAIPGLRHLWDQGAGFTVDLLGEIVVSEREALTYQRRYLELLEMLGPEVARWPVQEAGREEAFPRFGISLKLSSLYSQIDPVNFEGSLAVVKERLRPILRRAQQERAFVNIDMEHYVIKDLTLALFKSLLEDFPETPRAGIAIQMYLKDSLKDLGDLINWAQRLQRPIAVRLVKGAYWDYEQAVARLQGWPVPVFLDKRETDAAFEEATRICLEHYPLVRTCLASHNVRSLARGIVGARHLDLPPQAYEIQVLYGMAEPIKRALLKLGLSVREYVPIGEMLPGIAYLVRRLLENTSNQSFLRRTFTGGAPVEELLRAPEPPGEKPIAEVRL